MATEAQTQRYPKKMPEEAVLFLRMMVSFLAFVLVIRTAPILPWFCTVSQLLVRGLCSQLDAELMLGLMAQIKCIG